MRSVKSLLGLPVGLLMDKMDISVFAGLSVDGFLARKNDDIDFLPDDGNPEYGTFIATVDAILIGERTFEKVAEGIPLFGPLPRDIRLVHVRTRAFGRGVVTSEYTVG